MKKIIVIIILSVLIISCGKIGPWPDERFSGTWTPDHKEYHSYYIFSHETNAFKKITKSTDGFTVTTTTLEGYYEIEDPDYITLFYPEKYSSGWYELRSRFEITSLEEINNNRVGSAVYEAVYTDVLTDGFTEEDTILIFWYDFNSELDPTIQAFDTYKKVKPN